MRDLASNDRAEALQAVKLAVRAYARPLVQERSWRGGGAQAGPAAGQRGAVAGIEDRLAGRAPAPPGYLGERAILH
jgi:hypothetical protein